MILRHNVKEKVVWALQELNEDGLQLTEEELAAYVGCSHWTIAHYFGELRERGLIDRDKRQIVIKDVNGLQELLERI